MIDEVRAERERQQAVEGWTPEHDDQHEYAELVEMAACYILDTTRYANAQLVTFPFDDGDKRATHSTRKLLIIAAALIIAEIERLDRLNGDTEGGTDG